MSSHSSVTFAEGDPFACIHSVLRRHILEGNYVSASRLLANPRVHLDANFWKSPRLDKRLLAGLTVQSSIVSSGAGETQVDERGCASGCLSRAELHYLLKGAGGDDSVVSSAIKKIEGKLRASASRKKKRERSLSEDSDEVALDHPSAVEQPLHGVLGGGSEMQTPQRCQPTSNAADSSDWIDLAAIGAALLCSDVANVPAAVGQSQQPVVSVVVQSDIVRARPSSPPSSHSERLPQKQSEVAVAQPPQHQEMIHVQDALALPGSIRVSRTLEEFDSSLEAIPLRRALPSIACEKQCRKAFSAAEDEALVKGMGMFPVTPDRFSRILFAFRDVWAPGRSARQLADHWRAVLRTQARQK